MMVIYRAETISQKHALLVSTDIDNSTKFITMNRNNFYSCLCFSYSLLHQCYCLWQIKVHTIVRNCIFLVNEQKYPKIFDIILRSVNNLGGVSTFASSKCAKNIDVHTEIYYR